MVAVHAKNLAVGCLSLMAGAICLVWAGGSLLGGGLGTTQTVFFVALAVIAVLWLVRTANGLTGHPADYDGRHEGGTTGWAWTVRCG